MRHLLAGRPDGPYRGLLMVTVDLFDAAQQHGKRIDVPAVRKKAR